MTKLCQRLRRRLASGDSGMTLVELLTAMTVFALIGAAMIASLSMFARTDTTTTSQDRASTQAQTLIDRLSKDIHTAVASSASTTPFAYADATHFTVYADFADVNGPRKIDVYTSGGPANASLYEDTTLAAAGGVYTGTATHRLDSKDVTTTGGLFTYYDVNGNALAVPMTTASQLDDIASVGITLTTQEPGLSKPVTVNAQVYLRNVTYQ